MIELCIKGLGSDMKQVKEYLEQETTYIPISWNRNIKTKEYVIVVKVDNEAASFLILKYGKDNVWRR